jgi:hypothetical protein
MVATAGVSQTAAGEPRAPSPGEGVGLVRSFLRAQRTIRVFLEPAPGLGHHAAAIALMERLRELGFAGTVELIYDFAVEDALPYLLPGFRSDGSGIHEFPEIGLTAMRRSYFAEQVRDWVPLGLMAASDSQRDDDYRRWSKVDALLILQPKDWPGTHALHLADGTSVALPELTPLRYVFPRVRVGRIADFLERELGHADALRKKIPGLRALLERRADTLLLPVYGVGTYREEETPADLARLVRVSAALVAMQRSEQGARDKAIVVPLFLPLQPSDLAALETQLRPLREVDLVDGAEEGAERIIAGARPGRVLVVYLGPVSRHVYQHIVARASLPALVAGVNAVNLLEDLGKIYLNMKYPLRARQLQGQPWSELIASASAELRDGPGVTRLALFLGLAVRDPGLRRMFAALRPRSQEDVYRRDKLFHGLLRVIRELPAHPGVSGSRLAAALVAQQVVPVRRRRIWRPPAIAGGRPRAPHRLRWSAPARPRPR